MSELRSLRPADLHGLGRLGVEAVLQVTALVEAVHGGIQHVATLRPPRTGTRPDPIARLAYASVRGVTGAVGRTLELISRRMDWPAAAIPPSPRREALLAALNGVLGDHLAATGNPLAIPLTLWHAGLPLPLHDPQAARSALLQAGPRALVLLHGLCMNPWQWSRSGQGDAFAADGVAASARPQAENESADIESVARSLGYDVFSLHYNSGRRIAENGTELAVALQDLVDALPATPSELVLLGHSMGGLVARSAVHAGLAQGLGWSALPIKLVGLGSPHHGAPLERAGHGVEQLLHALPLVSPFAGVARARSAGITDLRHGTVLDSGVPPLPLPDSVKLHAVAASLSRSADVARPRGDGLVPVASALGRHRDARRDLGIPGERQAMVPGCGHIELIRHSETLSLLRRWLA